MRFGQPASASLTRRFIRLVALTALIWIPETSLSKTPDHSKTVVVLDGRYLIPNEYIGSVSNNNDVKSGVVINAMLPNLDPDTTAPTKSSSLDYFSRAVSVYASYDASIKNIDKDIRSRRIILEREKSTRVGCLDKYIVSSSVLRKQSNRPEDYFDEYISNSCKFDTYEILYCLNNSYSQKISTDPKLLTCNATFSRGRTIISVRFNASKLSNWNYIRPTIEHLIDSFKEQSGSVGAGHDQ